MPEETTTTENEVDIDQEADEEAQRFEAGLEKDDDGDAGDKDEESADLKAKRLAASETEKALREAEAEDLFNRRVKLYREMPSQDQKDSFLSTTFKGEGSRVEFAEQVAAIERTELVNKLVEANDEEALLAAYREADTLLQAAIDDAVTGDEELSRMLRSRVNENVVSLPVTEPVEGETEPAPVDFQARWLEGPIAETVEDVGEYAMQALADVRAGRVQVDKEIRSQLENLVAEADKYPENHSFRVRALQEAAGLASYEPMTRVVATTTYQKSDGSYWLRETDGRGKYTESVIEGGLAPSELGLLDKPATSETEFDPESINTLEDARDISPVDWAYGGTGFTVRRTRTCPGAWRTCSRNPVITWSCRIYLKAASRIHRKKRWNLSAS